MYMTSAKKQIKKIDAVIVAIQAICEPEFEQEDVRALNKQIHEIAPSPKPICEPNYFHSVDAVERTFSFPWTFQHVKFDSMKRNWHCQLENGTGLPFREYYGSAQTEAAARLVAYLRAHKGQFPNES